MRFGNWQLGLDNWKLSLAAVTWQMEAFQLRLWSCRCAAGICDLAVGTLQLKIEPLSWQLVAQKHRKTQPIAAEPNVTAPGLGLFL